MTNSKLELNANKIELITVVLQWNLVNLIVFLSAYLGSAYHDSNNGEESRNVI